MRRVAGERALRVVGAAEHNLRDVDVEIGPASPPSSACPGRGSRRSRSTPSTTRRAAGSSRRSRSARRGCGCRRAPVRRSTASARRSRSRRTSSTATRLARRDGDRRCTRSCAILFSRFAEVRCPSCGTAGRARSRRGARRARELRAAPGAVDVAVRPRGGPATRGSSLLSRAVRRGGASPSTARRWKGRALDPARPHDIVVDRRELADGDDGPARAEPARRRRARAARGRRRRASRCSARRSARAAAPGCRRWSRPLPARSARRHVIAHDRRARRSERPARCVRARRSPSSTGRPLGPRASRIVDELRRRLRPARRSSASTTSRSTGPMPTLSRGESQRVRLAVVLAGRLEDLLHVLDEPSIGLHRRDVDTALRRCSPAARSGR